eukprot:4846842-Amphidinium_carterae.1
MHSEHEALDCGRQPGCSQEGSLLVCSAGPGIPCMMYAIPQGAPVILVHAHSNGPPYLHQSCQEPQHRCMKPMIQGLWHMFRTDSGTVQSSQSDKRPACSF